MRNRDSSIYPIVATGLSANPRLQACKKACGHAHVARPKIPFLCYLEDTLITA
jgi:hypothetical protein